ncbi:MAG: TonB-dependent receptor [Spongiibacteraceae bacterium]
MGNNKKITGGVILVAVSSLLGSNSVLAQVGQGRSAALEEVIVSARKRDEGVQTVPIAISAMTAAEIDRSFATQMDEIKGIPNVALDQAPGYRNVASFYIRGIGYQDIDLTFEPAVGVVVDGIFLGKANGSLLDIFDLESLEILRGPQGTLFGKNTIGGVVSITTKRPQGDLGGEVQAKVGNYGRNDYRAAIEFPVTEKAAARLSVLSNNYDGYAKNQHGDNVGGEETVLARGTLVVEPSDNLTLTLIGDYLRDRSESSPMNNASVNQGEPKPLANALAALGFPADSDGDLNKVREDLTGPFDIDGWGLALQVDWIGETYDITSITGYRDQEEDTNTNVDGEALPLFNLPRVADFNQFYQEFRLGITSFDNFDFVAGLNYMRQEHNQNLGFFLDSYLLGFNIGAPGDLGTTLDTPQSQAVDTYGLFMQGDYSLTDDWRVTVGVRYSVDDKDYTYTETGFSDNNFGFLDYSLASVSAGAPALRGTQSFSESWEQVTWRVGTDYQIDYNTFAYLSIASGFKAGGFNGRASTFVQVGPYDPETVMSYEVGVKAEFFDSRLRINTAVFMNQYDDLQVEILQNVDGTSVTLVENAAGATISGIEIEATALLGELWTLQTSVGYLDASYDDFDADVFSRGYEVDNSGLDLRRAPPWTLTAALMYEQVFDFGSVFWQGDWSFHSDYETNVQNYAFGTRKSENLFNSSIGYAPLSDRWSIAAYVRNITDEVRVSSSNPIPPFSSFNQPTPPRTFGVELSVKF